MIAGDPALGREVEDHRDLFVYGPEPLDLEGLRRMRRLQIEQLVLPGTISAKYSPGALVDVEYVVQALQIVHGSRDPGLRSPNTLEALAALGAAGCLDVVKMATLRSSYQFFRLLIDALRVVRDHPKDLTVPGFGTDEFLLLSRRMRAAGPESLRSDLELLAPGNSIHRRRASFVTGLKSNRWSRRNRDKVNDPIAEAKSLSSQISSRSFGDGMASRVISFEVAAAWRSCRESVRRDSRKPSQASIPSPVFAEISQIGMPGRTD